MAQLLSLTACMAFSIPAQAQSTTQPTDGQSPETLDALWTQANQKFDAPRQKILSEMAYQAHDGPFRPDWASLSHYKIPDWYSNAKFGIFIHWGVYSVPAFSSEWYPRRMYENGSFEYKHEIATYGPQTAFGYKDMIPMFKAEHFNPEAWATLFRESGARYVVPVAEHHDGFAMYDSELTDWCATKMGPHRDLIGELATAIRKEGLRFGVSSHRAEHDWFFGEGRQIASDVNDSKYAALYGPAQQHIVKGDDSHLIEDWTYVSDAYLNDWLARTGEIIARYHPDLIYFDWWVGQASFRHHLATLAADYYNNAASRGKEVVINYKFSDMQENTGVLDIERGQLDGIRQLHWQTDTSLSDKSWGYIERDTYKSPQFILDQLVDIVSKNGNLLLNISPRADGTIPQAEQDTLLEIGRWLKINGEAIYDSSPWEKFGEGPTVTVSGSFHDTDTKTFTAEDFRFTQRSGLLYAIEMDRPASREAIIHSLALSATTLHVRAVQLLGAPPDSIEWQQLEDGLHIRIQHLPATLQYAYTYRIVYQQARRQLSENQK